LTRFKIYQPGMAPDYPDGYSDVVNTASVYLDQTGNNVKLMLNDGTSRHLVGTFSENGTFQNNGTLRTSLSKEHNKSIDDFLLTIGDKPEQTQSRKQYVALVLKKAEDGSIYVEAVDPRCGNKIPDGPLVKIKPSLSVYFYKTTNASLGFSHDRYGRIVVV
jgi:hypothetical protein